MSGGTIKPGDGRKRNARDLELVQRTLREEPDAIDEFLRRLACVRRFLSARNAAFGAPLNAAELEDTLQNTLLALWQKRAEFGGYGTLEAWAFRFSYLELLNRLQALRRRPRSLEDYRARGHAEPEATPLADPFEHELLYRALARLEPHGAELLRARHLVGLDFEEIAAREGVPLATIKTRYYRALERLRTLLGAGADVEAAGREP